MRKAVLGVSVLVCLKKKKKQENVFLLFDYSLYSHVFSSICTAIDMYLIYFAFNSFLWCKNFSFTNFFMIEIKQALLVSS